MDNITDELAVHFVEDGERDYKTARFTATDMMNICGPLGIGLFKFKAGRITANNRSLLEYFASKDRCFGSKKEEDWGNRLIEDGVKYPGSTPIHVDSFQYLIESRRPRVGFEMLTLLAENIQNKKDAVAISSMVFGDILNQSGRLLSAEEFRTKTILSFSKCLHNVLSSNSDSSLKVPWIPWRDTEQIADSIWNSCIEGTSIQEINLSLELAELTGSVSQDTYGKYLRKVFEIGVGSGVLLPMSVKADPYRLKHLIEPILKLGAGWLLNNHQSVYFDKVWPMPLSYINHKNSIIWEYCGFKIDDILEWIKRIDTAPWNIIPRIQTLWTN